jgi:hypothetical protein
VDQTDNAIARSDAIRVAKCVSTAVYALGELAVADALISTLHGDLAAPAFAEMTIDEVRRRVEPLRDPEVRSAFHVESTDAVSGGSPCSRP